MQEINYVATLWRGSKTIVMFGLMAALFGAGLSFVFPLQYSSTMRLLIIQKQLSQADPYTAIKASERIADNLGQIIYTTSFYEKVMGAKFNTDASVFSADEVKKRRQWREMIDTQVIRGTGMLAVTVYHVDRDQAEQFARAIAFVLTTDGAQYVGGGDLEIKLVDEPLQSRFPVKPNIPANAFTGLVLGIIVGSGYVLATSRRRGVFGD
ncbi:MAG: Wzz/FepE/Etk N-terminal domain-containing protein [Patescibacteria group bacterium]|nr:Wzz/FepE/Etk N-terminal domain-containing protein [Patescibacteria group bacterium]